MAPPGKVALAEKSAPGGAKMIHEYLAELRRQGRINGRLVVTVKEGRQRIELPFREA